MLKNLSMQQEESKHQSALQSNSMLNVINEEDEIERTHSLVSSNFETPLQSEQKPMSRPTIDGMQTYNNKEFGSLVKRIVQKSQKPNNNPKQAINVMGKLKGSEILQLKISTDNSRMVIYQTNNQLSVYEFEKPYKISKVVLEERPNQIVMIPDSVLMMLCNPSGIQLLLTNNLSQEYKKNKSLDDPDFKNLSEVRVCQRYIGFACHTGAIKIHYTFSYELKTVYRKTSEPCMSLDFAPDQDTVISGHRNGLIQVWKIN